MNFAKTLDGIIAAVGFAAGIYYAFAGEWHKAIFFMALATNCEIGYRLA